MFVKWHLAASVTLAMVFLPAQASINSERKAELLAFASLVGFGQGYAMVISHVSAPMAAEKQDMGLVAGIIVAFRNLNYSVLSKSIYCSRRLSHRDANALYLLDAILFAIVSVPPFDPVRSKQTER
jgi:hypothetical protein